MSELSKAVKEQRIKVGLSQLKVAKAVKYQTAQAISNWERGLSTPPLTHIGLYAKALKKPSNWIIGLMVDDYKKNLTASTRKKPVRKAKKVRKSLRKAK